MGRRQLHAVADEVTSEVEAIDEAMKRVDADRENNAVAQNETAEKPLPQSAATSAEPAAADSKLGDRPERRSGSRRRQKVVELSQLSPPTKTFNIKLAQELDTLVYQYLHHERMKTGKPKTKQEFGNEVLLEFFQRHNMPPKAAND